MPTPTVYVHDSNKNRYEGLTREQIINAIEQAVEQGEITDLDDGFITKIKELNASQNIQIWVGTTAQFSAIQTKAANTLYILTDDDSADDWDAIAEQLEATDDKIDEVLSGSRVVPNATNATNATNADKVICTNSNESVIADGYNDASELLYVNFRGAEDDYQIKEVRFLQGDRDVNKFARITTPCNTDFTHSTWTTYNGTAISAGTYEMRYTNYPQGAGGVQTYSFGVVTFASNITHSAVSSDKIGTTFNVEIAANGTMKLYSIDFVNGSATEVTLSSFNVLQYRRIQ